MANKVVVDTSILIDYYRKTDKANSVWFRLLQREFSFTVSVVTKYEIYAGATVSQLSFWNQVFQNIEVIALDEPTVDIAVTLDGLLKRKRKQIDLPDLFMAATALRTKRSLATLNKKHFERVDGLELLT